MRSMSRSLALFALAFLTALAPSAWAAEVQGKIKSFDPNAHVVVLDDGTQIVVPTTLRVERQMLRPGVDVKASYEEKDGQKVATSIAVTPKR